MALSLDTRFCGDVFILSCRGPIMIGPDVQALESCLQLAEREYSRIVVGAGELTRLDSTGLGMIIRQLDKLRRRGGDLRIAAPPPFLAQLLHITRLSGFVKTLASEDEAIVSFLSQPAKEAPPEPAGHRVLVIDPSADLGAFVRAVLAQHGYAVRAASTVHDAHMLLEHHPADFILFGPNCDQSTQLGAAELQPVAPQAVTLELTPEFTSYDALRGAEVLLEKFHAGVKPAA